VEEGWGSCDSLETEFALCWLWRYRPRHFVFPFLVGGRREHWEGGEHLEGGSIGKGGALEREQSIDILFFLYLVLLP